MKAVEDTVYPKTGKGEFKEECFSYGWNGIRRKVLGYNKWEKRRRNKFMEKKMKKYVKIKKRGGKVKYDELYRVKLWCVLRCLNMHERK